MKYIVSALLAVALLTSCGSKEVVTKGERYASLYNEKPVTLLVMPPINKTEAVEAKDYFYYSISRPLSECGYYVISPQLSMDVLKAESAYDAEEFIDRPLNKFGELFGADAVVFTEITKWKKRAVVWPEVEVKVRYVIKSTKTNEVIFERECEIEIDLREASSGGGLLGAALALASQIANTVTTDNVVAARLANCFVFSDIPRGKYSPKYLQDQDTPASAAKISGSFKKAEIPLSTTLLVGGGYQLEEGK